MNTGKINFRPIELSQRRDVTCESCFSYPFIESLSHPGTCANCGAPAPKPAEPKQEEFPPLPPECLEYDDYHMDQYQESLAAEGKDARTFFERYNQVNIDQQNLNDPIEIISTINFFILVVLFLYEVFRI